VYLGHVDSRPGVTVNSAHNASVGLLSDNSPRHDVGVDVFDDRVCAVGEGPYFDERTGRVGWVDILGCRVLWRDLATGETGAIPTPAHIGAAVPREGGGLVLCLPDGPALVDPDGTLHILDPYDVVDPSMRSNDAKADPVGRLWVGTMAYESTPGAGALYRLDPGATGPVRVLSGVTISNGLGWSPDGGRMYHADTPTQRIDVYDYDLSTGEMTGRREFVTVEGPGSPDGLCVDADGGVWVAVWDGGRVCRYTPDGALERTVRVPTPQVSSCAFAGPELDLLVITTAAQDGSVGAPGAGLTYAYRPGDVVGRHTDRFAG
jgi:sugar lactone lactonase YvrE